MSEIKTLTVNGRSYTVADPDAAHIDDTAVGEKAWSSRRIMEAIDTADSSAAIVCTARGQVVSVSDASDRPLRGLTLYGKTTQNGTPMPESPVPLESTGAGGSVAVNVYGKNLFYTNNYTQKQNATVIEQTENGATFRGNEGSNPGTRAWSNGWAMIDRTSALRLSAGTVITVSCDYTVLEKHSAISGNVDFFVDGISMNLSAFNVASAEIGRTYRISNTATVQADGSYKRTNISLHSSKVRIENLQWAIDTTAADFTPYTKQTLTVPTPNGLPGIPVESGGNYTDESGQQWVCDEVDFAKGILVRRTAKLELNGTESWSTYYNKMLRTKLPAASKGAGQVNAATCSHYPTFEHFTNYNNRDNAGYIGCDVSGSYLDFVDNVNCNGNLAAFQSLLQEKYSNGNPITVVYALAEPIETPLSAEELAQYSALHTNKPATTVLNDAGAGMALAYVADTKLYIDNKFNELAAAIVNNT